MSPGSCNQAFTEKMSTQAATLIEQACQRFLVKLHLSKDSFSIIGQRCNQGAILPWPPEIEGLVF